MLLIKPYERENALLYARRWVFSQNPLFANFRGIGGNCTNFVSQCVYAGSCRMNYTPILGWYYISLDDRTASWSGVEYFYNFIVGNRGIGPFGREVTSDMVEIGDVIQLYREDAGYYHTLLVVGFDGEEILVAAQTDDVYERPLSSYNYDKARFIKIDGVRLRRASGDDCFMGVYNGTSILPAAEDEIPMPQTQTPSEPQPESENPTE